MTRLADISDAATEEVLESDWAKRCGIALEADISRGGCELWARAVVRILLESQTIWVGGGHCMVEWHGHRFDSDTTYDELKEIEKEVWVERRQRPKRKNVRKQV